MTSGGKVANGLKEIGVRNTVSENSSLSYIMGQAFDIQAGAFDFLRTNIIVFRASENK